MEHLFVYFVLPLGNFHVQIFYDHLIQTQQRFFYCRFNGRKWILFVLLQMISLCLIVSLASSPTTFQIWCMRARTFTFLHWITSRYVRSVENYANRDDWMAMLYACAMFLKILLLRFVAAISWLVTDNSALTRFMRGIPHRKQIWIRFQITFNWFSGCAVDLHNSR